MFHYGLRTKDGQFFEFLDRRDLNTLVQAIGEVGIIIEKSSRKFQDEDAIGVFTIKEPNKEIFIPFHNIEAIDVEVL